VQAFFHDTQCLVTHIGRAKQSTRNPPEVWKSNLETENRSVESAHQLNCSLLLPSAMANGIESIQPNSLLSKSNKQQTSAAIDRQQDRRRAVRSPMQGPSRLPHRYPHDDVRSIAVDFPS